MIKQLIGTLFLICTLVVVALAILNYGNYRSLLFNNESNEVKTTQVATPDNGEDANGDVETLKDNESDTEADSTTPNVKSGEEKPIS